MPVNSKLLEALLLRDSPAQVSAEGGPTLPSGDFEKFRHLLRVFSRLPYENLTKILKMSRLEDPRQRLRFPDELLSDHLRLSTGGTCYSLAFCLREILGQLGFDAQLNSIAVLITIAMAETRIGLFFIVLSFIFRSMPLHWL